MTDPLSRLAANLPADGITGRGLAWIAGALAVGLILAVLVEPLWFVSLVADGLPWLVGSLLDATGLSATTAMGIWVGALVPATVFVFVLVRRWLAAHGDEHPEIRDRIRLRAFATGAFLAGFFAARLFVLAGTLPLPWGGTVDDALPLAELWINGHHVHHFFLGFALVALAGWLALLHPGLDRRWTAAVYGVGLGVFLDEIGLLLTWGDYWARSSWLFVALVVTLLVGATFLSWLKATADLQALAREAEPGPSFHDRG